MVNWKVVVVSVALFLVMFVGMTSMVLYSIGPDGSCYVRQAELYAEGDVWEGASGYWSPLLPAMSAPMIAGGVPSVIAFRISQGLIGVGYVIAAIWAAVRIFDLKNMGQWLVGLISACLCASWSSTLTTPDVAIAFFLLLYFPLTASSQFGKDWRLAAGAGMLGALAYLAKGYAFPYFLAHFTVCVALTFIWYRREISWWSAARTWLVGMIVFATFAGPWVALLSAKHGKFTFATSAGFNHFQVGVEEFDWKVLYQMQRPAEGRYNIWETPEQLQYEDWSPLESKENLKRQLGHIKLNIRKAMDCFAAFDAFALFPAALILSWLAALWSGPSSKRYVVFWMIPTCGIYVGGYLPMPLELRYIWPVLFPLCLSQLWAFVEWMRTTPPEDAGEAHSPWRRYVPICFALFLFGSCVLRPTYYWARDAFNDRANASLHHETGKTLIGEEAEGPIAMIGDKWDDGLLISYYAKMTFIGKTYADDWEAAERELDAFDIRTLIVDSRDPLAEEVAQQDQWREIMTTPVLDYEWRFYRRGAEKTAD
ncbi:MAG: ArnT family glycosyltransferase [Blastopirellula sp. JB062]